MSDWFSNLATQAFKFADDLADSIVSQANEAQAQIIQEKRKLEVEENQKKRIFQDHHQLPWETDIESRQILCKDLMEKMLALSLNEKNFTTKSPNSEEVEFYFQEFVPVAMQLLQIDSNLARIHAKLSPKMNEEDLWFNYFCRIVYLRARSGIEGPEALSNTLKWKEADIISSTEISAPVLLKDPNFSSNSTSKGNFSDQKVSASGITQQKSDIRSISSMTSSQDKAVVPNNQSKKEEEIDLDDLDDVDVDMELADMKDLDLLEEIGDISPEDFEKIGSSEGNDELEAQIAQELADDDDT
jgi:hypothetical protein